MRPLLSPVAILYDAQGNELAVDRDVAIPASTQGLVVLGLDGGGVTRAVRIAADGTVSAAIDGVSTEATLASILAKLDVDLSTRASEVTLATRASEATSSAILAALGPLATEATLAAVSAALDTPLSTRASEATLAAIAAAVATEVTQAAVRAAVEAVQASVASLDASVDVALSTRASETTALAVQAATEATQAATESIDADVDVALSTRASESTLTNVQTALDQINAEVDVNLSTRASEATLDTVRSIVADIESRTPLTRPRVTGVLGMSIVSPLATQVEVRFPNGAPSALMDVTLGGAGSTAQVGGAGQFKTGGAGGSVIAESFDTAEYSSGRTIIAAWTSVWTVPPTAGDSVAFVGADNGSDGYSVGYKGGVFGVRYLNNTIETFVPQASWNIDTCTGQAGSVFTRDGVPEPLNKQTLNIFAVSFVWFGAGAATFWICSPDNGLIPVHKFKHPNLNPSVQTSTPDHPLRVHLATPTEATDVELRSGCLVSLLAVNANMVRRPNGDYSPAKASALGDLLVAQGSRIGQVLGRTEITVPALNVVASGVIYTPPAGKRLVALTIQITGSNSSLIAAARVRIRDGGAGGQTKYSVSIEEAGGTIDKVGNQHAAYASPVLFNTNVYVQVVTGTPNVDIVIVGYLEDL